MYYLELCVYQRKGRQPTFPFQAFFPKKAKLHENLKLGKITVPRLTQQTYGEVDIKENRKIETYKRCQKPIRVEIKKNCKKRKYGTVWWPKSTEFVWLYPSVLKAIEIKNCDNELVEINDNSNSVTGKILRWQKEHNNFQIYLKLFFCCVHLDSVLFTFC